MSGKHRILSIRSLKIKWVSNLITKDFDLKNNPSNYSYS